MLSGLDHPDSCVATIPILLGGGLPPGPTSDPVAEAQRSQGLGGLVLEASLPPPRDAHPVGAGKQSAGNGD